jgi:hypothetical protein
VLVALARRAEVVLEPLGQVSASVQQHTRGCHQTTLASDQEMDWLVVSCGEVALMERTQGTGAPQARGLCPQNGGPGTLEPAQWTVVPDVHPRVDPHQLTPSDSASELGACRAVRQRLLSGEHIGLPVLQCGPRVHDFQHRHVSTSPPPDTVLAVDNEFSGSGAKRSRTCLA